MYRRASNGATLARAENLGVFGGAATGCKHEAATPFRFILDLKILLAQVLNDRRRALQWMHKFIVGAIHTVLDGTLVVAIDFKYYDVVGAPLVITVFRNVVYGGAIFFRQITEKPEYDAVAFFGRVGIHFGTCRGFFIFAVGRDILAFAVPAKLPAVIGALYKIAFDLASAQCTAAVNASVTYHMGLALGVAESDKFEAHNLGLNGSFVGDFFAQGHRIPKVDVHRYLPFPACQVGLFQSIRRVHATRIYPNSKRILTEAELSALQPLKVFISRALQAILSGRRTVAVERYQCSQTGEQPAGKGEARPRSAQPSPGRWKSEPVEASSP